MIGTIRVEFDTDTGRIMIDAPLTNQAQKDLTVKVLAAAIPIVVDYKESVIIDPNKKNGTKPVKVITPIKPTVTH